MLAMEIGSHFSDLSLHGNDTISTEMLIFARIDYRFHRDDVYLKKSSAARRLALRDTLKRMDRMCKRADLS